jgi:hypothetical protein
MEVDIDINNYSNDLTQNNNDDNQIDFYIDNATVNKKDNLDSDLEELFNKISDIPDSEGFNTEITMKNYEPKYFDFKISKLNHFSEVTKFEKEVNNKIKKELKEFLNIDKSNTIDFISKERNFDLKRNLASKINTLHRKTDIAIAEIISELKKNEKN